MARRSYPTPRGESSSEFLDKMARLYDRTLLKREYLVIYSDQGQPRALRVAFSSKNWLHLAGYGKGLSTYRSTTYTRLFDLACAGRLDYERLSLGKGGTLGLLEKRLELGAMCAWPANADAVCGLRETGDMCVVSRPDGMGLIVGDRGHESMVPLSLLQLHEYEYEKRMIRPRPIIAVLSRRRGRPLYDKVEQFDPRWEARDIPSLAALLDPVVDARQLSAPNVFARQQALSFDDGVWQRTADECRDPEALEEAMRQGPFVTVTAQGDLEGHESPEEALRASVGLPSPAAQRCPDLLRAAATGLTLQAATYVGMSRWEQEAMVAMTRGQWKSVPEARYAARSVPSPIRTMDQLAAAARWVGDPEPALDKVEIVKS